MADEGPGGFVPEGFDVPRELVTTEFRLEPLGPQHNARDYEAWTSSIDHIRATPGFPDGSWPDPGMSPGQNLADLRRHAGDFARRAGFTYTVLAGAGDRVVGCVYIYPSKSGGGREARGRDKQSGGGREARGRDKQSGDGVADVSSWVRADRADLDVPLYQAVSAWLAEAWPFTVVRYAAR